MVSIRMIILCGNSFCKPLLIIFNDCSNQGRFPAKWKEAEVVPVHKKGDKQNLKNYRPISLPPISSKSFEHLTYNTVFTYLLRIIWFLQVNPDLELMTFVFINYLLILIKFIKWWWFGSNGIFLRYIISLTFDLLN